MSDKMEKQQRSTTPTYSQQHPPQQQQQHYPMPYAYQPYQAIVYTRPIYVESNESRHRRSDLHNTVLCCLYGSLIAVSCCLCFDALHLAHHVAVHW